MQVFKNVKKDEKIRIVRKNLEKLYTIFYLCDIITICIIRFVVY